MRDEQRMPEWREHLMISPLGFFFSYFLLGGFIVSLFSMEWGGFVYAAMFLFFLAWCVAHLFVDVETRLVTWAASWKPPEKQRA